MGPLFRDKPSAKIGAGAGERLGRYFVHNFVRSATSIPIRRYSEYFSSDFSGSVITPDSVTLPATAVPVIKSGGGTVATFVGPIVPALMNAASPAQPAGVPKPAVSAAVMAARRWSSVGCTIH